MWSYLNSVSEGGYVKTCHIPRPAEPSLRVINVNRPTVPIDMAWSMFSLISSLQSIHCLQHIVGLHCVCITDCITDQAQVYLKHPKCGHPHGKWKGHHGTWSCWVLAENNPLFCHFLHLPVSVPCLGYYPLDRSNNQRTWWVSAPVPRLSR